MAQKQVQGRFAQKIDTTANWDKAVNFIPMLGEIIIYKDNDIVKEKIGDGVTTVGNLKFNTDNTLAYSGVAADAKAVGQALENKQPLGDYALKEDLNVYVQDDEPIDVPDGTVWVDTDEPGGNTFEYIATPTVAKVGQTIIVKEVDEDGKPTAWEAVDMSVTAEADWNENNQESPAYIKNRTHYEAPPLFDITWDGVIGDRFALDMSSFGFPGIYFVKVDDRAFTLEEMSGAIIEINDGTTDMIMPEHCDTYTYPGVYDIRSYVVVAYDADKLSAALGLPTGIITNGTYFYTRPNDEIFVTHFASRDNSKKLDTKYLPDDYPYESEPKFNIIWNGDMEGRTVLDMSALGYDGAYFVKISDIVPSKEDVINSSYAFNWNFGNQNDNVAEWDIYDTYPGTYDIASEIVVVYDQDMINSTLGLPEGYLTNGIYFVANPTQKAYIARFTGKTEVHKLHEKYLPDNLNRNLATVATTGNYYDLNNRPNVYTDVVRYGVSQSLSASQRLTARSNIDVYSKSEVDDKLTNIEIGNVDLSNYYTSTEVDSKISEAITGAIGGSY